MKSIATNMLYQMQKGRATCLVCVSSSEGSVPRKRGAAMLAGPDGYITGTVGGGAVELKAIEMATDCIKSRRDMRHVFTLAPNSTEDIGMLCGGDVTLDFRYIDPSDERWKEWAGKIMDAPSGERAVIFGAGHCARALAPILKSVGFDVHIYDNRPDYARDDYFEGCTVTCGSYSEIEDWKPLKAEDYIVIMTCGHAFDKEVELYALREHHAYVGVIGSKRKVEAVRKSLLAEGISEEILDTVHTPIGLSIHAETPEEIAVSIAAEMILERANRKS